MQTVISVFEDRHDAQLAMERLLAAGFEPENVHLQPGAAAANTAVAASLRAASMAEHSDRDRGVLASIGHFFASLFDQDPPTRGYALRFAEAVRRGHPAIMVDAKDDEEVDRASTIMHQFGAFDIDERLAEWRDRAGTNVGAGQQTQAQRGSLPGIHVVERDSAQPIREVVRQHEEDALGERPILNRPVSMEGESQVIDHAERDRAERERAVAASQRREPTPRENDLEAREPKGNTPPRDT